MRSNGISVPNDDDDDDDVAIAIGLADHTSALLAMSAARLQETEWMIFVREAKPRRRRLYYPYVSIFMYQITSGYFKPKCW